MDDCATQRNHVRETIGRLAGERAVQAVMPLARPAVRLTHATEAPLKATRIGGLPLLPSGMSWPERNEQPMRFLAHIDLAEIGEVAAGAGWPRAGALDLFCAADGPLPWGEEPGDGDGWRVVSGDGGRSDAGVPRQAVTFPEQPLSARPFVSLPGPAEPSVRLSGDDHFAYEQVYQAWLRYVWPDGRPYHQAGGWPVLTGRSLWLSSARAAAGQPAPLERQPLDDHLEAATEWRLVAQLWSDDRAGWLPGIDGAACLVAHRADLAAGRFGRSWLTFQCREPFLSWRDYSWRDHPARWLAERRVAAHGMRVLRDRGR